MNEYSYSWVINNNELLSYSTAVVSVSNGDEYKVNNGFEMLSRLATALWLVAGDVLLCRVDFLSVGPDVRSVGVLLGLSSSGGRH